MTLPPLFARRFAQLIAGLFLYGIGISLMVRASLGIAPWDVLTQGISEQTGWSFGALTNAIGLAVLLLWIPIRQKPGLGTVLNVLLIGPSAQFGLWLFPEFQGLWQQVPAFAAGLLVLALATGMYIGANFGPGPRDGLMTGLHRRNGWPIGRVRTLIEASVLLAGWAMGGDAGRGTLVFALSIGPMCAVTMRWFAAKPPRLAGDAAAAAEAPASG
ncbi:MAG: YczE/YyaS/YitT family protein [Pseudoxanthomonas sp.]